MEININDKKKKKVYKYPLSPINIMESNQKKPEKFRAKTYESISSNTQDIEDNKGILEINSDYLKSFINKNSPKSTKKRSKKEILYKYINHSYFKDSFGSIPVKSEKILLENKSNISQRFSGNDPILNKIKDNTPGVGSYNLEYDWKLKNNAIYMENSDENRFGEDLGYRNYYPCVGHYDAYKGEKYEKEKNNLRYDSLYNRTRVLFNENTNKNFYDKGFIYNPKYLNDVYNNKKKFNFGSYSSRNNYRGSKIPSVLANINNNPGPNYYFNEFNFELKSGGTHKIQLTNQSTDTNLKLTKDKNLFSKNNEKLIFQGKNKYDIYKPNFVMKQHGNIKDNKVYNLEDIFKMKNNKKIIVDKKKDLENKLKENEKNVTSKKLYFSIEQDKELERIKKILGNDNGRPDFFYLSPDRWKNKNNELITPGPGYYFYHSNID